jgi:hypothetical protein
MVVIDEEPLLWLTIAYVQCEFSLAKSLKQNESWGISLKIKYIGGREKTCVINIEFWW